MRDYTTKRQIILDQVRDVLIFFYNLYLIFVKPRSNYIKRKVQRNRLLMNTNLDTKCFVLGNGPTLKNQDIVALKSSVVFAVNRLFLDPRYKLLKPKYHVFIDNKLATGEWELGILDQVFNVNPEVTFILNANWLLDPKFQTLDKKFRIIWVNMTLKLSRYASARRLDISRLALGSNVVENAIICAQYLGYKTIYVTGIDGDGFIDILNEQNSHAYGSNQEDLDKFQSPSGVREAISSVADWLLCWEYLSRLMARRDTKIINLTGRGLFNMLAKDDYSRVIKLLERSNHK